MRKIVLPLVILFSTLTGNSQCLPVSIVCSSGEITFTHINVLSAFPGNWEIEYGLSGFSQGTGEIIRFQTLEYTLTGLQPGTGYDCYIRDSCDNGEYSEWNGPFIFNTADLFTKISIENTGIGLMEGDAKWGDFDNDGNYDIVCTGTSNMGGHLTKLFRMNAGSYTEVAAGLPQLRYSSCAWGDYDNDGDLDLLISGLSTNKRVSVVYRNDNGSFIDIKTGLTGVTSGNVAWCDFDKDGNPDIILSGLDENAEFRTLIYKNTGLDNFVEVAVPLKACFHGNFDLCDYNKDGFIDIVMAGSDISGNMHSTLYKNMGGMNFIEINAGLLRLFSEGVVINWIDFDCDGNQDIFLAGSTNSRLYRNNGDDTFTEINAELNLTINTNASAIWEDYDNDGYKDLLISYTDYSYQNHTKLFKNDGTGKFTEINTNLSSVSRASLCWGDYDNDGDLDLLLTGIDNNSNYYFTIYSNNLNMVNNIPSVPADLDYHTSNKVVYLKWAPCQDVETVTECLTYNVRIGSAEGKTDIVSPVSNITTGHNLLPEKGNSGFDTFFIITGLKPGTYYWSVQSVDNGLKYSAFSSERPFQVLPDFVPYIFDTEIAYQNAVAAGDFNDDGYLDIIISGIQSWPGTSVLTKLYRNEGNLSFTPVDAGIVNLHKGAMAWGDFNNDNKLDLLICGAASGGNNVTAIYRNDGDGVFTDINANLQGISYGSLDWGDYNNDGHVDALIGGSGYTRLYKNNGDGCFSLVPKSFIGAYYCTVSFGDYDNDFDLDIFVLGNQPVVYKNMGNDTFKEIKIDNSGLSEGRGQLFDFDNDGDPDIIITGRDPVSFDVQTRIYRNDGNDQFTLIPASLRGVKEGSVSTGDYNNDGRTDILLTGLSGTGISHVYRNNPDNTFENIYADLKGDMESSSEWGDFDNDGNLDILLAGAYSKNVIYRSTLNYPNTPPQAPANLISKRIGYGIILGWDKAEDQQSKSGGLTYNIRIGTTSGGYDIVSPMSDINTGFRKISKTGNAETNKGWIINRLPVGVYYWSVQAIDHGFEGGAWAPEQTFSITMLTAGFSADTVCLGVPVTFEDLSVSSGTSISDWFWDFGDGSFSILQNPVHEFENPGIHSVKLKVSADSFSDSIIQEVLVKPKPLVDFTASLACQGSETILTNLTDAQGLTITSWSWDYGDGKGSILQNPVSHGYLAAGDYQLALYATAENGCQGSMQKTVTVASYPVAVITTNAPLTFCAGDSVTLSVGENSNYTYQWLLGGTAITDAATSSFKARQTGDYTVQVVNTSGSCATTSDMVSVIARSAPVSPTILAGSAVSFCQGDSVLLSVTYNTDLTYQWKLNGGDVGGNTHDFKAKAGGNYNLMVSNSTGCTSMSTNTIVVTVKSLPASSTVALSGPTVFCGGGDLTMSVPFTAGYTYRWENEYGAIAGAESNAYTALTSGNYLLVIGNSEGCEVKSNSIPVTVKENPEVPVIIAENYEAGQCLGDIPVILRANPAITGHTFQWKRNGIIIPGAIQSRYEGVREAGEYTVVADNQGCKAESGVQSVVLGQGPPKPALIAEGPMVWYLACSNDSAAQYRWYYDGQVISGADKHIYVANQDMGTYMVSISTGQGCFTFSDPVTIPPEAIGVFNEPVFSSLKIFPNPTTGMFTIEMNNKVYGDLHISIFAEEGRKILHIRFTKNTDHFSTQVDLSGQGSGVYIVKFLLDKYGVSRKMVVE